MNICARIFEKIQRLHMSQWDRFFHEGLLILCCGIVSNVWDNCFKKLIGLIQVVDNIVFLVSCVRFSERPHKMCTLFWEPVQVPYIFILKTLLTKMCVVYPFDQYMFCSKWDMTGTFWLFYTNCTFLVHLQMSVYIIVSYCQYSLFKCHLLHSLND